MNKDSDKTKEQLLAELAELRKKSKEKEDKLQVSNQQLEANNQQLHASETRMRNLFNVMQDLVFEMDYNGTYLNIAPTSSQLLVKPAEEVTGKTLHDVFPKQQADLFLQFIQKCIDENKADKIIYPIEIDNKTIWFEGRANPIGNKRVLYIASDITERKQTEEKLKESEEKFRALYDNAPLSYQSLNEDGSFKDVNLTWLNTLGYERDEVIGKFYKDFLHLDWQAHFEKNFPAFKKRGYVHDVQFKIRHKKGHYLDISFVGCIGYNPDGTFKQTYCVFQDITERKRTEKTLEESEKRFSNIIENTEAGYFFITKEGFFQNVNEAWLKMHGYLSPEEVIGQHFSMTQIDTDIEAANEIVKKLIDGVPIPTGEFSRRCKDGSIRYHTFSINPVFQNEEVVGLEGFLIDITERKQAEEKLREREERFRGLYENSAIGLYRTTPEGKILLANPCLVKMLGYSSFEELEKRDLSKEGFEPDYPRKKFKRLMNEKGKVRGLESKWIRKDGKVIYVRESAKAFHDENGNILYYEGTLEDITERKQAENELKESKEKLRAINAEKDKFFSTIAHDLKSPFNSILGFSDLLVEQVQKNDYDGIEEYAKVIQDSSQRAVDLLMNLMEWSRSQTGRMEFTPEYLEIADITKETTGLLEPVAGQKSITIKNKTPQKSIAFADKAMINTVIRNLISNAIKFTKPGGEIKVSAHKKPNELIVSVSDTGVGIPQDKIEKLFVLSESYSTKGTNKEKGTGLGLILCREFVEKNGGKIRVESDPDGKPGGNLPGGKAGGSTFYFTLPYHP